MSSQRKPLSKDGIFKSESKILLFVDDISHTKILDFEIPKKKKGTIHLRFDRKIKKWKGVMYCSKDDCILKKEVLHCFENFLKIRNLNSVSFFGLENCKRDFKVSEFLVSFTDFHSRNIDVYYYPISKGGLSEGKVVKVEKSNEGSSSLNLSKTVNFKGTTNYYFFGNLKIEGWETLFENNRGEIEKIGRTIEKDLKSIPVYPKKEDIFKVFSLSPSKIKVLLIGQDPYHNEGEAMGLSFSVREGIKVPPSLRNIYKELINDGFKIKNQHSGDLTKWFKRGVFLLNATMTVKENQPKSHQKVWKDFMGCVLSYLDMNCKNLVIIAMGADAQRMTSNFSQTHKQIKIGHPSPLNTSSATPFLGTKPFSRANVFLKGFGKQEIDWNL